MPFPTFNTFSIFLLVLEVLQRKLTLSGHHYLDRIQRSVSLRHNRRELSSSKKICRKMSKI